MSDFFLHGFEPPKATAVPEPAPCRHSSEPGPDSLPDGGLYKLIFVSQRPLAVKRKKRLIFFSYFEMFHNIPQVNIMNKRS